MFYVFQVKQVVQRSRRGGMLYMDQIGILKARRGADDYYRAIAPRPTSTATCYGANVKEL